MLEVQSLNQWTCREVPVMNLLKASHCPPHGFCQGHLALATNLLGWKTFHGSSSQAGPQLSPQGGTGCSFFHQIQKYGLLLPPLSSSTFRALTASASFVSPDFSLSPEIPKRHRNNWPKVLPPAFALSLGSRMGDFCFVDGKCPMVPQPLCLKKSQLTNSLPCHCVYIGKMYVCAQNHTTTRTQLRNHFQKLLH